MYSGGSGYAEIVDTLIAAGADVDIKFGNNKSALSEALFFNKLYIAKLLIKSGADLNVNVQIATSGDLLKTAVEYITEKSTEHPEWQEVLDLLPNSGKMTEAFTKAKDPSENEVSRGEQLLSITYNLSCVKEGLPLFREYQVTAQETFFGKLVSKTGAIKTHAIKTSLASKDLYENTALHIAASIGAELLVANILCSFRSGPEGTILQQISRVNKGKKTAENLASDRGEVKIAELLHSIANQGVGKAELNPMFIESQCEPIFHDYILLSGEAGDAAAASADA
jgi:ankyrin repeat protein